MILDNELYGWKGGYMIRQIVGRCHISETNKEVIRYVISRLQNGYQTYKFMPKSARRKMLQEIVKEHNSNIEEYHMVMGGRI